MSVPPLPPPPINKVISIQVPWNFKIDVTCNRCHLPFKLFATFLNHMKNSKKCSTFPSSPKKIHNQQQEQAKALPEQEQVQHEEELFDNDNDEFMSDSESNSVNESIQISATSEGGQVLAPIQTKEDESRCPFCSKVLNGRLGLNAHLQHGKYPCEYPDCQTVITTTCEMKKHYASHLKCEKCPSLSFESKKLYLRHLASDKREEAEAKKKQDLMDKAKEMGMMDEHGKVKARDLITVKRSMAPPSKKIKREEEIPKYYCPICTKEFFKMTCMKHHLERNKKESPCPFLTCSNKFSYTCELYLHLQTHETIPINICPDCDAYFIIEENLTRHIKEIHVENQDPEQANRKSSPCEQCPETFKTALKLQKHMKLIHNRKEIEEQQEKEAEEQEQAETCTNENGNDGKQTEVEIVKCPVEDCEQVFKSGLALLNHGKMHATKEERSIVDRRCPHCHRGVYNVKKHLEQTRKDTKCPFPSCDVFYTQSCALFIHLKSHETVPLKFCPECDDTFMSDEALTLHMKQKHEDGSDEEQDAFFTRPEYKCEPCSKTFTKLVQFQKHVRQKHPQPKAEKTQQSEEPESAQQSPSTSTNKSTATGKYPCPLQGCTKVLKTLAALSAHAQSHRDIEDRLELDLCMQCGKKVHRHKFLAHMRTHDESLVKWLFCEEAGCNRKFKHKSALRHHQIGHNGDRLFACTHLNCSSTFKRPWELRSHERHSHPIEKNFKCTFEGCGWATATKYQMKRHMQKHTKEKKYDCPFCDKSFHYKETLYRHKYVHTHGRSHPNLKADSESASKPQVKRERGEEDDPDLEFLDQIEEEDEDEMDGDDDEDSEMDEDDD